MSRNLHNNNNNNQNNNNDGEEFNKLEHDFIRFLEYEIKKLPSIKKYQCLVHYLKMCLKMKDEQIVFLKELLFFASSQQHHQP